MSIRSVVIARLHRMRINFCIYLCNSWQALDPCLMLTRDNTSLKYGPLHRAIHSMATCFPRKRALGVEVSRMGVIFIIQFQKWHYTNSFVFKQPFYFVITLYCKSYKEKLEFSNAALLVSPHVSISHCPGMFFKTKKSTFVQYY